MNLKILKIIIKTVSKLSWNQDYQLDKLSNLISLVIFNDLVQNLNDSIPSLGRSIQFTRKIFN